MKNLIYLLTCWMLIGCTNPSTEKQTTTENQPVDENTVKQTEEKETEKGNFEIYLGRWQTVFGRKMDWQNQPRYC